MICRYTRHTTPHKSHAFHDWHAGRRNHTWSNEHGSRNTLRNHAPWWLRPDQHALYAQWADTHHDALQHARTVDDAARARLGGQYSATKAKWDDAFQSVPSPPTTPIVTLHAAAGLWRQHATSKKCQWSVFPSAEPGGLQ